MLVMTSPLMSFTLYATKLQEANLDLCGEKGTTVNIFTFLYHYSYGKHFPGTSECIILNVLDLPTD